MVVLRKCDLSFSYSHFGVLVTWCSVHFCTQEHQFLLVTACDCVIVAWTIFCEIKYINKQLLYKSSCKGFLRVLLDREAYVGHN